MKALSVRPPWSGLIMYGGKDVENREWSTRFRGHVAIHASSKTTKADLLEGLSVYESILGHPIQGVAQRIWWGRVVCTPGSILGTVEIVDCVEDSASRWFNGRYGFVLRNPRPLKSPIPCLGKLGLWEVPEGIEQL